MSDSIKGKATICIVNYKTLELTKLCLRSIRKFTHYPYEVVVVDNDSQDASLDYLKSLGWITLIERRAKPGDLGGGVAHAAALDMALDKCTTEFFVSMHSDTLVQADGWLADLMRYFEKDRSVQCVGAGKLELIPQWRIILKKATDLRTFKSRLLREPDPLGKRRHYNRTICSLYRTDTLKKENLTFSMDRDIGFTGGKKLYFELVDRGYKTVELAPRVMGRYVVHLAHATQVVNRTEFPVKRRTIAKCTRLMERIINSDMVQDILADESLDN